MNTGFAEFWQSVKELLFPSQCLACGASLARSLLKQDLLFCETCIRDVRPLKEPLCNRCGKPFHNSAGGNHLCSTCLSYSWNFVRARALVQYSDPMAKSIQALKYLGKTTGLSTFIVLNNRISQPGDILDPDLILPVPLHPRRLRERGFNQALLLARNFFPDMKDKIDAMILERQRHTAPQAGLSGPSRRKNVKGAFRVKKPDKVKGKKILLVDDVYTTGATVDECAMVLRRAGAKEVQVLTLARAGE